MGKTTRVKFKKTKYEMTNAPYKTFKTKKRKPSTIKKKLT